MQTVRVLLVDTKETVKQLLEQRIVDAQSLKFVVTLIGSREAKHTIRKNKNTFDVILFGERASAATVVDLTKLIRLRDASIPIFKLTLESEAKLTQKFNLAGVDDMLNIAEIATPLFTWTFQSMLEHADVRRKAKEYDVLRHRLEHVSESIGNVIHEINTPLSVIRLTLYHLEKPDLPKDKRETFVKLLAENLQKVDDSMGALRSIRRQLGEDTSILAKILSLKAVKQVVATT